MHESPETAPIELLFISGSLQRVSANRALLATAANCAQGIARVTTFDGIAELPHFNPDLDGDTIAALAEWRAAVAHSDAVVIATPEYAHSLPGSLKNALDWIVGTGELYDKPVALMSAGTSGGQRSLDALAQTLRAQGAQVDAQLPVAGIRPKLDDNGDLADAETIAQVCALIGRIVETARNAHAPRRLRRTDFSAELLSHRTSATELLSHRTSQPRRWRPRPRSRSREAPSREPPLRRAGPPESGRRAL